MYTFSLFQVSNLFLFARVGWWGRSIGFSWSYRVYFGKDVSFQDKSAAKMSKIICHPNIRWWTNYRFHQVKITIWWGLKLSRFSIVFQTCRSSSFYYARSSLLGFSIYVSFKKVILVLKPVEILLSIMQIFCSFILL